MSAVPHYVVTRNRVVTYDGTNSADIDALISDFTIVSETGGVLNFTSNGGMQTAQAGYQIFYNEIGIVTDSVSPANYASQVIELPDFAAQQTAFDNLASAVSDLSDQVALVGGNVAAAGIATFPAIGANSNATVPVDISPAMPDSSYNAAAQIFGGVNLGALTVTAVAVVDTDTVNVTIHNGGLLSLGASVLVTATV